VRLQNRSRVPKKLQLISLMDVVFLLLLFFLVSVFFSSMPNEERKLFVPTPKNEPGYAQVLVQLIDDNSFFYIDPSMTEQLVREITEIDGRTYMSAAQRLSEKKQLLLQRNVFALTSKGSIVNNLRPKLETLVQTANNHPEEKYFVIIRCPDDIPYAAVIDVIQILSRARYKNIQYGCLGGTIADIQNSKSIEKKLVNEDGAIRRNVVIQF